jgi:hypothetical protein
MLQKTLKTYVHIVRYAQLGLPCLFSARINFSLLLSFLVQNNSLLCWDLCTCIMEQIFAMVHYIELVRFFFL